jgi:flagellar biosynthesis protein
MWSRDSRSSGRRSPSRRQIAVALCYRKDVAPAPRVLARGEGQLAAKMVEIARAHKIPVREDDDLAAILGQLPIGQEISESIYKAIAEVLALIYRMNRRAGLPIS